MRKSCPFSSERCKGEGCALWIATRGCAIKVVARKVG